ncbi:MAG: DUF4160 domain-containing protein [Zoogloeaceae bacterium]|jgi:hypothetical protein|nr:DUF4160 domain-containing protein [Zoogloeaceae bacterium]
MTVKHRFRHRYRLELRERDHLPPHVHLTGGAVNVRISLETFAYHGQCPHDLLDEAVAWVKEHRDELMENWKKWHP